MKKFQIYLLTSFLAIEMALACADYNPDFDYYNLFAQEIVDDPQYYPFLLTYESGYYTAYNKNDVGKNENIEEWESYLGLSYDDTYYLVFKASRENIRNLLDNKQVTDKKLKFANAAFVKKHKQALLYLAYAKYLEPYMTISQSESAWGYYSEKEFTADQLDYQKVITVLQKSWNAETDKELKLRYGYQLVRFAHYNRKYKEAIAFFDKYVEPLNYKQPMYYHALSQKAGAQRGSGYADEANYNFFKVFTKSKELKAQALSSIRFTENVDFERFLEKAKSENEINDAYLLLGYISFNDPLSAAEKILANSPDAIQARVLMARTVNFIERECNRSFYCWDDNCLKNTSDKRYPVLTKGENDAFYTFFDKAWTISLKMSTQPKTKDKNFWNLTAAYLCFLKKDFKQAKSFLGYVEGKDAKYKRQKENLSMFIDICEHPQITNELESSFYEKYRLFEKKGSRWYWMDNSESTLSYNTRNFVIDVLANRYFLQKEYAKSFLLNNDIMALESNPRLDLLDDLEKFYTKASKNKLENYMLDRMYPWLNDSTKFSPRQFDMQGYIDYMRGNIYLAQGNLEKSLESFKKIKPGFIVYRSSWGDAVPLRGTEEYGGETGYMGFEGISNLVFGYNQIECFDCKDAFNMEVDYLTDFPFIKQRMNKKELVEALIQLKKIGEKNDEKGSKANYLAGNFFYNVTRTGFYRHLLRFDRNNGICEKYRVNTKKDIYDNIYLKYYSTYFDNNTQLPQQYLEKAYTQAKDNELKARIVFALSKCEQESYYDVNAFDSPYDLQQDEEDKILIKGRKYFAELQKYKNTAFYEEVRTNCLYFQYYVSHY